jgi:hypothetical protein
VTTDRSIVRPAPASLPALADLRVLRARRGSHDARPTVARPTRRVLPAVEGGQRVTRDDPHVHQRPAPFCALPGAQRHRRLHRDFDVLPVSILEQWILWLRKAKHPRSGKPLQRATIATYLYSVSDMFKWAARRQYVPERFRWAELAANAAGTLRKVPKRSARLD